jgi:hypothetical protein
MSDGIHIIYWRDKCKKLEKALDKACNELVELDEITVQERESYCWNKEEWKEWCLKDD